MKASHTPLDADWYEEYKKIGSFLPYTFLSGDRASHEIQKSLFLKGEIRNPTFEYPFLDHDMYVVMRAKLIALQDRITNQEKNELVRRAYGWKIAEKLNELEILLAACRQDMSSFQRYSESCYGAPKLEVFEFSLHTLRLLMDEYLGSKNEIIKNAAVELDQEIDQYFPQNTPEITRFSLPTQKTISVARQYTYKELGYLIQGIGTHKKEYVSHDIEKLFSSSLAKLGATGWTASIDTTSTSAIHVDHTNKQVKIPFDRTMTHEKLLAIILHEIGTHVARRINGEKSVLMLLGLGLNGYERADEGLATMREQVFDDQIVEFARAERHVAVSLCYGLDGKKRDFRDVYTALEKYIFFKSLVQGMAVEDSKKYSEDLAWVTCERTFRGTDCSTAGVCLTKDIMYQEGNIAIWNLLETNPSELMRFNVGKYDPTNLEHCQLLNDLGIRI